MVNILISKSSDEISCILCRLKPLLTRLWRNGIYTKAIPVDRDSGNFSSFYLVYSTFFPFATYSAVRVVSNELMEYHGHESCFLGKYAHHPLNCDAGSKNSTRIKHNLPDGQHQRGRPENIPTRSFLWLIIAL